MSLLNKERIMNRKEFVHVAGLGAAATAIGGIGGCRSGLTGSPSSASSKTVTAGSSRTRALYVANGRNRFDEEMMIWGVIPLQVKVSTADSAGALFVFEHANMSKGGPPRHFHYEQDEWFHAVTGDFLFEVGDERFTLRPGDSLFAPRMVPARLGLRGRQSGTLLLAVQPAGSLEAFFLQSSKMAKLPSPEERSNNSPLMG
jgi:mannose-6-phosphate isomerase-like protein (cupin superfamily)